MTSPDVAALARAMAPVWAGWERATSSRAMLDDAEAIIAALAAQGWRITSAPEASSIPEVTGDGVGTADDPVSAQAASDCCGGCVCEVPHGDAVRAALEGHEAALKERGWWDEYEVETNIAINYGEGMAEGRRAALEGLRAEVWALEYWCHDREGISCDKPEREDGRCGSVERDDVMALIDARLADLT